MSKNIRSVTKDKLKRILENIRSEQRVLAESLKDVIVSTRALQLWIHGAHNLTKGTAFAGDHDALYGRIYTELDAEYDRLVERSIGVTADDTLGCPVSNSAVSLEIMQRYGSPAGLGGDQIAQVALRMLRDHRRLVTDTAKGVGGHDVGTDDLLASHTGQIDTYIYLMSRRVNA